MKKIILAFLMISLVLSGCGKINSKDYKEIYILALESLIGEDPGLNGDMKYIAIDTSNLAGCSEKDIKEIVDYFRKYDVDVIEESFESLKEKGMVKEYNEIEGILLRVISVDEKADKNFKVEVSKFRSGKGAIELACKIIYDDKIWKLESVEKTGIS